MKICKNCFQAFEDIPLPHESPAENLVNIVLDSENDNDYSPQESHDLCPSCREALGVLNMLGFGL